MDNRYQNINNDAINAFDKVADALINTKFILAERRISDVLKTIASTPPIMEIVKTALKDYNHRIEFENAKYLHITRRYLRVPESKIKTIAFVFCVLLEIDTEKTTLREFIETYFYHSSQSLQLSNFINALVIPFKTAMDYVYTNGYNDTPAAAETPVQNSAVSIVRQTIHELKVKTLKLSSVSGTLRSDLVTSLDSLSNALTPNRLELVPAIVNGIRYMVSSSLETKDVLNDKINHLIILLNDANLI